MANAILWRFNLRSIKKNFNCRAFSLEQTEKRGIKGRMPGNLSYLADYEKEYLMAMLYIFDYHRYNDIQEDLNHLIKINSYLDKVLSLDNEVIFSSIDTEQK